MTKKCRYLLLTLILAISLVVCSCLIIACDETPEDTTVTYTVTVKTDATTPAQGVTVQLSKGSVDFDPATTDANGKATFKLAPDNYTVSLDNLPDGYSVGDDADMALTADKKDLTITLNKNFAYTIKLVDPNGAAYYQAGVTVMICTIEEGNAPGQCLTPVALGTNGIATIEAKPYNYHAKINGLPENVKYVCDDEGYYTSETLSATKTELTITVTTYTITSVTDATPMTDEKKAEVAATLSSYTADADLAAYYFKTTLNAGQAAYYSITPEFDGDYRIYHTSDNGSNYLLGGTTFKADNQGKGLYGYGYPFMLKAGNTYYLTVLNNQETADDFEFVIEAPAASHIQTTMVGEIDVTIAKEGAKAIIEFKPSIGAAFKLTGPEDISASIIQAISQSGTTHPADSYQTSAECTARFTEDLIGSTGILYFSIEVQNVSEYPVTFKVTLDKTADLKNTTTPIHAEAALEEYGAQQGELTYIAMDGTAELVKDDNGIYHLGTIDGPVVVVMLTGNLPANRFASTERSALVYIDKNVDSGSYKLILDVTEDKTSLTQGNTFNDYRLMLRGFADYKATPTAQGFTLENPDEITEQHYYAKYANDDGVYPLTDELKAFLQAFAATYSNKINATEGEEWLFACCYYDSETPEPIEDDAIIGEYEFVSGMIDGDEVKVGDTTEVWDETQQTYVEGTIGANEYKLVVSKGGTFVISKLNRNANEYEGVESGEWSKTADGYSFIIPEGTFDYDEDWNTVLIDLVYTVTFNSETGTINLVFELDGLDWNFIKPSEGNDDPEPSEDDAIVGEYELVSITIGETTYNVGDSYRAGPWDTEGTPVTKTCVTLTISKTKFIISDDLTYMFTFNGTWSKNGNAYTFTVPEGKQDPDTYEMVDLILTVTFNSENGRIAISNEFDGEVYTIVLGHTNSQNNDAVIGEYNLVSLAQGDTICNVGDNYHMGPWDTEGTPVTETCISLVVSATKFFITDDLTYMFTYSGTWSKNGDTYTFTVPEGAQDPDTYETVDLILTVTFDSENGRITISNEFDGEVYTIVLEK